MKHVNNFFTVSVFVVILSIFTGVACAHAAQLVRVDLNSSHDLETLLTSGLAVMSMPDEQTAEVVLYQESELQILQRSGLHFDVIHESLEEFYMSRLQPQRDDIGGYRSLEELNAELFQIHDDFPEIFSEPLSIGRSLEGRDIYAVKISDNPQEDEDEPEILMTSLIHSDEFSTAEVVFGLIYLLLENYGENEYITNLVNEREIWLVPCHNPDGLAYCADMFLMGELRLWRGNRRDLGNGFIGVDLNRNYGYMWNAHQMGGYGARGFSEPETQVLREFVNAHHFKIAIYFHACGSEYINPLGFDYLYAPDRHLFDALGEKFTAENNYVCGTGWELMYSCTGNSDDWLYMSEEHDPVYAVSVEVGTANDGHIPPRGRIPAIVNENMGMCLTAIDYCDDPFRALPPPPPENLTLPENENGVPELTWDVPEDESNPPIGYNIMTRSPEEEFLDDAEEDLDFWDVVNVRRTPGGAHSGRYSYSFDPYPKHGASLTSKHEFVAPDRIWAWMRYLLEYPLALEVTTDGYTWESMPGLGTQDCIVAGYNHGPAILQRGQDWRHVWWDMGEYAAKMVKIRFKYTHTGYRNDDYCYIDDIEPLRFSEWTEVVAENIADQVWSGENHEFDPDVEYCVQSIDAEGDVSFMSSPTRLEPQEVLKSLNVTLTQGWNLISINVSPLRQFWADEEGPDIIRMTEQLRVGEEGHHLQIMKDEFGQFYAPGQDYNNIPCWDLTRAYWLCVDENMETEWTGNPIPGNTEIMLTEGWNSIAYLPSYSLDGSSPDFRVLSPVLDHVILAKDESGRFMLPRYNFSNMPAWHESKGYQVKVSEQVVFQYPAEQQRFVVSLADNPATESGFDFGNSHENMSVLVASISGFDDCDGSYAVVAYDALGSEVGYGEPGKNGEAGLAIWGDDALTAEKDGLLPGESFVLRLRKNDGSAQIPLNINRITEGSELVYHVDQYTVIEAGIEQKTSSLLPVVASIQSVSPNPFNSVTTVTYSLPVESRITLQICNTRGQLVDVLLDRVMTAGSHTVVWDGSEVSAGVYMLRLLDANGSSVGNVQNIILLK